MLRRALLLVLAGGKGSRLDVLTVGRAKPSLPVGGTYRLIDVALSNAANSGLRDVWVVQQYEPHLLNDHLAGGRPWDLDGTRGGLRALPPFEGGAGEGFAEGNADVLARQARLIDAFDPEVVLISSADHLCTVDLDQLAEVHLASGADLTVLTTDLQRSQDPTRHALVDVDRRGRVTGLHDKPDDPPHRTAATEVFAYSPDALLGTLSGLLAEGEALGDYGEELVPTLVADGDVRALRHDGHWRDLGTPEAYLTPSSSCSDRAPRCGWTTRTGRSPAPPSTASRPGSRARPGSTDPGSARERRSEGRSWGRWSAPASSSRRGPRSATACCSTT